MNTTLLNYGQHLILLNEKEAAQALAVSVPTLRRWRLLGRGPIFRKLNGAVRYATTDLNQFVDERSRTSTRRAA
jgi:predicted site-specific integrase-resolvase